MTLQKTIIASFIIEGIHSWPECDIDEVKYLRHPHRHQFHIRASKNVTHNDRDIEFIQLTHTMRDYLIAQYQNQNTINKCCDFGRLSCEDIAEELIRAFDLTACEVLEDNESGALLTISNGQ